jgi:hypothetical protein
MAKKDKANPVLEEPIVDDGTDVGVVEDFEDDDAGYDAEPIAWSAVDDSQHQRGGKWYLVWVLILVVLAGASLAANLWLGIWQIWTSVGLAVVIFISLVVVNKQPGRTIKYELTDSDVTINDKSFPLKDFQSFSVADHGTSQTVSLVPTKRVSIPYDLIVPTKDAGEVIELLSAHLPLNQAGLNFTDKISSILKF